jgi:hypothetical protein
MDVVSLPSAVPEAANNGGPAVAVVKGTGIVRRYGEGDTAVDALRGVSVEIAQGRLTAVMGSATTRWAASGTCRTSAPSGSACSAARHSYSTSTPRATTPRPHGACRRSPRRRSASRCRSERSRQRADRRPDHQERSWNGG